MNQAIESPLKAWSDFYVVMGSSAAALIGLTFVVITLVAGDRSRATGDGIGTYTTPTVVHLGAVLAIAGVATAPWPDGNLLTVPLALLGLAGVAYQIRTTLRAHRIRDVYTPDLDDIAWYMVLPSIAYLILVVAAASLRAQPLWAPFGIGLATLGLIFIAIHNAWDVVTYLATQVDEKKP